MSVEAAFRTSYEALDEQSRRLFRVLGTLPTPIGAAALDEAALRLLVDRNLVSRIGGERCVLHALLHEYARLEAEHPVSAGSVVQTAAA